MIRKTLIALSAAATIALAFGTTSAKADSFGFGFGSGGASFYVGTGFHGHHHHMHPDFYDSGYYAADFGCHNVLKQKWVWNAWHTHKIPVLVEKTVCY